MAQPPRPGPEIHAMSLTPDGETPIRVYVDDGGSRHLLVPAEAATELDPIRGDALVCELRSLSFAGETARFLDVTCQRPGLFEVFDDLLASILEAAAESGDPLDAAITTLRRWRDLLRAWSLSMSHEAEMGLFAELHVLELLTRASRSLAPEIWRGPHHEPKDIVAHDYWIEVKAAAPSSQYVWIHGLDQLQDLPGADGYLAVVTVVEDADGRTIEDVAAELRSRCDDRREFEALLLLARWVPHADAHRWVAVDLDVVRASDCPRLPAPDQLHAGIGRVRYEIDLAITRSHRLQGPTDVLVALGAAA